MVNPVAENVILQLKIDGHMHNHIRPVIERKYYANTCSGAKSMRTTHRD